MRGSVISTAHQVGLPSSSTMMYGHGHPAHWIRHLRIVARDPATNRWVHRIRRTAVRASERALVPRGQKPDQDPLREDILVTGHGPIDARRCDCEHPGLVGETQARRCRQTPAGRRQRSPAARSWRRRSAAWPARPRLLGQCRATARDGRTGWASGRPADDDDLSAGGERRAPFGAVNSGERGARPGGCRPRRAL